MSGIAETEAMADGDLALQAERTRALNDQFQGEHSHLAGFVQMDVERP
jgi:hypothetical protein